MSMPALLRRVVLAGLCVLSPTVWGPTVKITAFYEPDPNNPHNTHFINTTPQAAFCLRWPEYCRALGAFSVGIPITYNKESVQGASDVRDRFFVQLPGQRNFQISNVATGRSYPVEFRITHVSQMGRSMRLGDSIHNHPIFTQYPGGGCRYLKTFHQTSRPREVHYLWNVTNPPAPAGCHSQSSFAPNGHQVPLEMETFGIGFELNLPPPLDIPNGMYTATQTFSVGPGAEFDLGNHVSGLNTSEVTLEFELAVNHHLKTEFPPGSERAVLEPRDGWAGWVNRGQRPEQLQRDIPFRVWSSGPFSMYTLCQYPQGAGCAMRRNGGDTLAAFNVAVSLPAHIQVGNGRPVRREVLPVGRQNALNLRTVSAAFQQPATLHFQTVGTAVEQMLAHPGSQFEGIVTVFFEPFI
ncbi:hypothetical protein [Pseudomonas rubra]|uniref:Uncharacterized protein n=1 Tax=Pseudomonas rubra TaxID=2942627 RepID=A0ABT5P2B7_9PSED|nr:hypothetical protein [Pseudomonas rubra]MDD1012400.1 hypothetical protein [Pseudomonas rubra]MDD1037253.1 hypothetical protein [Pseudomonas rubra]MDD1152970.1 hypothetical protein [Pseudomonas rubra]